VSGTGSKCPEMIGYIGDVRNLDAHRAEATSNEKIEAWVRRSNSVEFATLFYSSDDVYHVGRMQSKLLKINPKLKFQQISSIEKFIDYVDTGMDRNEHPVKDIEMIHVYSTWETNVDYVEEARKRHEPEVRQISREDLQEIGDAIAKKMVINIFLGNKEQNKTKPITDADVYQQVKDSYGWDQASTIKDQILAISDVAKSGVDELKDKRELLTKGIKSLKPQNLLIKAATNVIPAYQALQAIDKMKKVSQELDKKQENYEQCMKDYKDFNSKHFGDMKRCIVIQENMMIHLQSGAFDAAGYEALDPKNIKKIKNIMEHNKR